MARLWMWCRRNPLMAGAASTVAMALVVVAAMSLLYARQQTHLAAARKLYAEEQTRRADEQTEAAARISGLAKNLETESQHLKTSLADSNRRLAMLNFERGRLACEQGEVSAGLFWLIASWRAAIEAGDPDWKRVARKNLAAWQCACPSVKAIFSHDGDITTVAFSPDGKVVLTAGGSTMQLWDPATGKPIGIPHKGAQSSIFSPDLTKALSAGQPARLWDSATGKSIGQPLSHGERWVDAGAFSPDGNVVLTMGQDDHTARLWDTATGKPIGQPLQHQERVVAVAFRYDSRVCLTVSYDGAARFWDAHTGQPIGPPSLHQGEVPAVAFSPDGQVVVIGLADEAQLRHATTGQPLGPPLHHPGGVDRIAFSPDGRTILTSPLAPHLDDSHGARGMIARLWDASSQRPLGKPLAHPRGICAAIFSPDGKTVLTGGEDGMARLWDATTGLPLGPPLAHRGAVLSCGL